MLKHVIDFCLPFLFLQLLLVCISMSCTVVRLAVFYGDAGVVVIALVHRPPLYAIGLLALVLDILLLMHHGRRLHIQRVIFLFDGLMAFVRAFCAVCVLLPGNVCCCFVVCWSNSSGPGKKKMMQQATSKEGEDLCVVRSRSARFGAK